MYVITHHHDYDEVLLGPIDWNPKFISSVLQTDLDLLYRPTVLASDEQKVPYEILQNVWVRKVVEQSESINPKTQTLIGPYWSYPAKEDSEAENVGIAEYRATDKPIEIVKSELKEILAAERYKKEVAGVKTTIQGQEVTVDTMRGERDVFVQKYLLMADNDTVEWKFPEIWLTLTKEDLGTAVSAGVNHVQDCFNWEASKVTEIDSCTTLEELDAIVIVEKVENNRPNLNQPISEE
jgi:hypothetical protein